MIEIQAIGCLSALAQTDRLAAFRLLMQAGPQGAASGELAQRLQMAPARMSFHLASLERAGLIRSQRQGRHIVYSARMETMSGLIEFLTEDCCGGRPGLCGLPLGREKQEPVPMHVTIYHNPACGTSRNTLAMIREAGEDPQVIEYLKTPPSRDELVDLIQRMGISPRDLLRQKGTPYDELGLGDDRFSDDELIGFMIAHPILMNRPVVVTEKGAALCRPSEKVLELLPEGAIGRFVKEDGEVVQGNSPE